MVLSYGGIDMIIKSNELKTQLRENMRGGEGTARVTELVTEKELLGKGRLFATITLEKGVGIGYHVHEGDTEIFHILSGRALYSDAGDEREVTAGDVLVCPVGTGHSIKNIGSEDVVLTALILYA